MADEDFKIVLYKKVKDMVKTGSGSITWEEEYTIDVPNVNRSDFQLIDISDDGFVTLKNDKGDTRDDLRLPEGDLGQKLKDEYEREDNTVIVTVMSVVVEEAIIACKNASS